MPLRQFGTPAFDDATVYFVLRCRCADRHPQDQISLDGCPFFLWVSRAHQSVMWIVAVPSSEMVWLRCNPKIDSLIGSFEWVGVWISPSCEPS